MNILHKIFKTKNRKIDDSYCNHDWEIIGYGKVYRYFRSCIEEYEYYLEYFLVNDCEFAKPAKKMVCIKCGKCVDEEIVWKKRYLIQELNKEIKRKEKEKRKKLAEKMWENC